MKKDKNKNECTINYVHLFCFNSWWKFIKDVATSSLYDIFFLRSTNGKKFWDFDRQCVLVILKKCRRLHSWDPSPPHVCKRLQLGTPSPPKNCGRPLWTAPYINSILNKESNRMSLCVTPLFILENSQIPSLALYSFQKQHNFFWNSFCILWDRR